VFRDLAADRDGMPTYPGDPDVTLRAPDATHEEDGYATSELRTDSTPDPRTRCGTPLPEGSRSTSERWASSRSTRASIFGRWSREAITAEELPEPERPDPAVDLLVFRTGWAAHWGDRSVPRPPVPDRGPRGRCQKLGVGVGLDTFGPDPTPPGSAKTTGPSRETEPEGNPPLTTPFKRFAADRGEPVRALTGSRGIPAVRLPAHLRADGRRCERSRSGRGDRGGVLPRARQTKPVLAVGDESRLKVDIHGNATSFQHVLSQL